MSRYSAFELGGIQLVVCHECGALVAGQAAHDEFHSKRELAKELEAERFGLSGGRRW